MISYLYGQLEVQINLNDDEDFKKSHKTLKKNLLNLIYRFSILINHSRSN